MLDVTTAAGLKTVTQEDEAVNVYTSHHPAIEYVRTAKDSAARIDAFLVRGGQILAAVETKCRTFTEQTFHDDYRSRWLVTWEKIEACRSIAAELRVPLVGFLYLTTEQVLYTVQITDASGQFIAPITIESTATQATVNGGTARRNNAYIDVRTDAQHVKRYDRCR
jgi:hypothetical protein